MGVVYQVKDTRTGGRYALKTLSASAGPELLLRFKREGEAQARANSHPNVVRVHTSGTARGRHYLVMDLASGGDLKARLEKGPLEPKEAARVVGALASGLQWLHEVGVLHRDLKPANILFDEHGTPQLVDFGLAKLADSHSLTQTGTIMGTPSHMAPEQAEGRREEISPRTDVYGLGAVLYHCLTGCAPFGGSSPMAVLVQVIGKKPTSISELAPEVPAGLQAICERCLAKSPSKRYATAAELRAELDLFSGGVLESTSGRSVVALALLALLLVVGAVLTVLLASRSQTPAPPPHEASRADEEISGADEGISRADEKVGEAALERIRLLSASRSVIEELEAWLRDYPRHPLRDEARELRAEIRLKVPYLVLTHTQLDFEERPNGLTRAARFCADGFVTDNRKGILLWDLEGRVSPLRPTDFIGALVPLGQDEVIYSSRDLTRLNVRSGDTRVVHPGIPLLTVQHFLSVDPSGQRAAIRTRGTIQILSLDEDEVELAKFSIARQGVGFTQCLMLDADRILVIRRDTEAETEELELWAINARSKLFSRPSRPAIRALEVTPDGTRVAVGSREGVLRLLDAENLVEVFAFEVETRYGNRAHEGGVLCLAISADGRRLCSVGRRKYDEAGLFELSTWDFETGERLHRLDLESKPLISGLDLSPDGRYALITYANRIELWALVTPPSIKTPR